MSKELKAVCNYYNITPDNIFSDISRKQKTIQYRQMLMYVIKESDPSISLQEILDYFRWNGFYYQNHSSIVLGLKAINQKFGYNIKLRDDSREILAMINGADVPKFVVVGRVDLLKRLVR